MQSKKMFFRVILFFAMIGCYGLMASESLAKVINIRLYNHVRGGSYQQFLLDYSQYQLKEIIECDRECNSGWYIFNRSIIDEHEFVDMLNSDPRVAAAGPNPPGHYWEPRNISIVLSEGIDEFEFLKDYSDFRLRGSIPGAIPYWERNSYTFDDSLIYSGDMLKMLKADKKVLHADFGIGWFPGIMTFVLKEGWVLAEIIDDLLEDFSHFEIEIRYHPEFPDIILDFQFDFRLYDEFQFLHELQNDERMSGAGFLWCPIPLICPGPITSKSDEPAIQMSRSSAYPNPVRKGDITIRWTDPPLSPLAKGGNVLSPEINIYNVRGQLIKTSNDFQTKDGENVFIWNRRDDRGQEVASGVYLYRIQYANNSVYPPPAPSKGGGYDVGVSKREDNMSASNDFITGKFLILK